MPGAIAALCGSFFGIAFGLTGVGSIFAVPFRALGHRKKCAAFPRGCVAGSSGLPEALPMNRHNAAHTKANSKQKHTK
jgi:uncharacterized membrane protein YfcA